MITNQRQKGATARISQMLFHAWVKTVKNMLMSVTVGVWLRGYKLQQVFFLPSVVRSVRYIFSKNQL